MNAAVWIAGGQDYAQDAARSAESVRAQMPYLERLLVTDAPSTPGVFTRAISMPQRTAHAPWYLQSCRAYVQAYKALDGYDKLIFLDTDTYCAFPFYDLMEVLDRYDIVATHGAARCTAPTVNPIPDAFPELEIGLLGVRKNDRSELLFDEWLTLYEEHPGVYGNNDQGPFREALWNNQDVRLYVVAAEYHCRWPFGAQVCGKVRLLHSRNGDQAAMAAVFNQHGLMRLVCPTGITWSSKLPD
jgi:hypothetical protein